ncbi:MAG: hypothetical protein AB7C89_07705 [Intestinibacillus sp.]
MVGEIRAAYGNKGWGFSSAFVIFYCWSEVVPSTTQANLLKTLSDLEAHFRHGEVRHVADGDKTYCEYPLLAEELIAHWTFVCDRDVFPISLYLLSFSGCLVSVIYHDRFHFLKMVRYRCVIALLQCHPLFFEMSQRFYTAVLVKR